MVEKNGAATSLAWREIEALSLLVLHRILVDATTDPGEKAERLVRAAAFAWLAGLKAEAQGMVREVVEERPTFERKWEEMLELFGE